jgi:hypothetical protein
MKILEFGACEYASGEKQWPIARDYCVDILVRRTLVDCGCLHRCFSSLRTFLSELRLKTGTDLQTGGHLDSLSIRKTIPRHRGGKISHPWTTMHDGPTSRTCNPFFWPFGTQNVPPSLRQPIRPPPPLHTPPPPPHRSTVACWAPSVWPTCKFKPI